jgi:hypothetical protein
MTKEGAEQAIDTHKSAAKTEWEEWRDLACNEKDGFYKNTEQFEKMHPFGNHQAWDIVEDELQN